MKAGPTRPRIELGLRSEQIAAAADTLVYAFILEIMIFPGEGPLCLTASGNYVLLGSQNLTPLIIGHPGILYILILKLVFLAHNIHILRGTHGPLL